MEDFDKKENEELVERFAQMIHNGTLDYFDSTEIEIIIDELMSDFDLELANEAIEYAIKTFPFNSIFRILKVKKLILEFALEDAEKELSRFEELFPLTSQFYLEKALLARITGKDINSLELLQKAFDLDSDNPEIHFSLAYEYIKNRDINKALKYAKLAISADDFFDEQLFMLSFLFEESGHYEEARQFFSALTEDFPLNKGAWFGLALAYSGLNDFEKSIEANLYVLSIDDELPTVYYNIGNSYFELAEYETAEKYYIKTLEFDPEDTLSLTAIGNCYTFKNMPSVALEYYQKAFRINENDLDTILGLLGTLIELGKKNEAFHFIHKIASISSYSNEYFFLILPLFTTDVDVIHYEELKYLFHETLNNVEDRTEFLESFTVYCCKNNLCNMGIELLHLYLDDDDLYPTLVYYLAALHYVNSENNKGNEFLKLALLINYDYWIEFMALHEILNEIPSIKELIELYRPV